MGDVGDGSSWIPNRFRSRCNYTTIRHGTCIRRCIWSGLELTGAPSRTPSVFSIQEVEGHQSPQIQDEVSDTLPLAVMGVVVLVWGLGPPISKLVTAPPLIGTFFRFGISSPFLLLVLAARRRMLSRRVLAATALPGLSFGVNLIFVFATLQEATISVLSTVVAMQPALLLVLAGPLFREYPTQRQLVFT